MRAGVEQHCDAAIQQVSKRSRGWPACLLTSVGGRLPPPLRHAHSRSLYMLPCLAEAARDFVSFILALNEAVKGKQLSDSCPVGGRL